jgi:hypothetical protein
MTAYSGALRRVLYAHVDTVRPVGGLDRIRGGVADRSPPARARRWLYTTLPARVTVRFVKGGRCRA